MEIIGHIAAVLTTASFVPQAVKVIRTKDTKGISLIMYIVFTLGVFLWMLYGMMNGLMPVILANIVTFVFAFIILIYKIRYK